MLRTDGLTVAFSRLVAVQDVSFHALPNEVVGLIGANGAGKSTLLNAIGGFVPARGRVELLGQDVSSRSTHQRARGDWGEPSRPQPFSPSSPSEKSCRGSRHVERHRSGGRSSTIPARPRLSTSGETRPRSSSTSWDSVGSPTASWRSCPQARGESSSLPPSSQRLRPVHPPDAADVGRSA